MTVMGISQAQIEKIEDILITSIRNKLEKHNPEPAVMPFHTRLLGESRLALYSFIHSLNTNFGTTIFEPVALALAGERFKIAESQVVAGSAISEDAHAEIQKIMREINADEKKSDKSAEIRRIREAATRGKMLDVKPTRVDLMFESDAGERYMFDLKTAKPNKGNIKEFKRTLLEWVAVTLASNPQKEVHTYIAIPYNPYHPEPYGRWTVEGELDPVHDLKVAEGFWDFIGGEGAYKDLLGCFERVGIELKGELDGYFAEHFDK